MDYLKLLAGQAGLLDLIDNAGKGTEAPYGTGSKPATPVNTQPPSPLPQPGNQPLPAGGLPGLANYDRHVQFVIPAPYPRKMMLPPVFPG